MRAGKPARILPSARDLPQRAKIVRRVRLGEARYGRVPKQRRGRRNRDHVEHAVRMRERRRALQGPRIRQAATYMAPVH